LDDLGFLDIVAFQITANWLLIGDRAARFTDLGAGSGLLT